MNHDKFVYWKQQVVTAIGIEYAWYMRDKSSRNGVHFHGTESPVLATILQDNEYGFMAAGLEKHGATGTGKPSRKDCTVTCGKCWHDGTSLYAMERLGHINPRVADEEIWQVLEKWYDSCFAEVAK